MGDGRLDRWAKLAEIAASIGVLVTLVILVFEIRDNTDATKRATYDDVLQAMTEFRRAGFDEDVRRLWVRGRAGEYAHFNPEERMLRDSYIMTMWLVYERAYWANEHEQMGAAEWERFDRNICNSAERTLTVPATRLRKRRKRALALWPQSSQ